MKEESPKFMCWRALWSLLPCSEQSLRIKTTDDVKYLERKQLVLESQAKTGLNNWHMSRTCIHLLLLAYT